MHDATSQPARTTDKARRAALWTSALVLGGLLAAQTLLGAPPVGGGGGSAHAGMVSSRGSHTILTADATNEDIVLVLDGRGEQLFVYRTEQNKGLQLFQKLSLPTVFADAKARVAGK